MGRSVWLYKMYFGNKIYYIEYIYIMTDDKYKQNLDIVNILTAV